jgi:hypothetical protein
VLRRGRLLSAAAAIAAAMVLCACAQDDVGGTSGAMTGASVRDRWAGLRACLSRAGATFSDAETGVEPGDWGPEGQIAAKLAGTGVYLSVYRTEKMAALAELGSAGLAGTTQVGGVPLSTLLGHRGNVLVLYQKRPSPQAAAKLGRCLGGRPHMDPALAAKLAAAPDASRGCTAALRDAFHELAVYPGTHVALTTDYDEGGCAGELVTHDGPKVVVAHYRRELQRHGWTVTKADAGEAAEGQDIEVGGLAASRADLGFGLVYEAGSGLQGGGTSAVIRIARR